MLSNGPRDIWAKLFVCTRDVKTRQVEVCLDANGHLPMKTVSRDLLMDTVEKLFRDVFGFEPATNSRWGWASLNLIDVSDDGESIDLCYGSILPDRCDFASKGFEWVGLHSGDPRIQDLNKLLDFSMRV